MTNTVCVLTGDIIASSRADDEALEAAFKSLAQGAERLERWWSKGAPSRFTRYRGDGWHLVISDPTRSLRSAMYLVASLRQADTGLSTRISIGIGAVRHMGTDDLSDASGTAFLLSGQGLDRMKRGELMSIDGEGVTLLHKAIVALAAERAQRWSREQAEAILLSMTNDSMTQGDAARQLGISTQAVSARLSAAGFSAMMEAIGHWEATAGVPGEDRP